MNTPLNRIVLAVCLAAACLASACASSAGGDGARRSRNQGEDYVFAFLVSGAEAPDLAESELTEVMLGHFSNMAELAKDGRLLLAGPFADPRVDPRNRGIFLFDTSDLGEAAAWAGSDPAVIAGVLDVELFPFRTSAPVRKLPGMERQDEARRLAEDPDSEWAGRGYVLATAAEASAAAMAAVPEVAVGGRFGGERAGTALYFLDVTGLDEAEALLGAQLADASLELVLHPWYGTRMVGELER